MRNFMINWAGVSAILLTVANMHVAEAQTLDIEVDSLATDPETQPSTEVADPAFFILGQTFNSIDIPIADTTGNIQSENSVVISPLNPQVLLNSNNSATWPPPATFLGADYFISTNGGQTWDGSVLGAAGPNGGDPATAIDRNGFYYIGYITADRGQAVAWSVNGTSWTHVDLAEKPPGNGANILDKNHLCIDTRLPDQSLYSGRLYSAWTHIDRTLTPQIYDVYASGSPGGSQQDWSPPVNLSEGLEGVLHLAVNLRVGLQGEVYAVWAVYDQPPTVADESAIGFARSMDGGATWDPPRRIIDGIRGIRLTGLGGGKTMRANSNPTMAVDHTGKLYVVWTNRGNPLGTTGDPDIYCITSTDQGEHWGAPTRVNRDPINNGRDQWFPWIAADPVDNTVAVAFYDSRLFSANDRAETYVAISKDGGLSWEDARVSDVSWPADGIAGFSAGYAGDYIGLDVRGGTFYPTWTDDRSGRLLAYISPFRPEGNQFVVPGEVGQIADALAVAAAGDEILVTDPITQIGQITIPNGVKLTASPEVTPTLDGDGATSAVIFGDGSSGVSELSGFRIQNFTSYGVQFGVTNSLSLQATIRDCEIDGGTATSTRRAFAYDDGSVSVINCSVRNVGRVVQSRSTGATTGLLTFDNCDLYTTDGVWYRPGITLDMKQSTMRCVYPGSFPTRAFWDGNYSSTVLTRSIVMGFDWLLWSTTIPCSQQRVITENLFYNNVFSDCSIDYGQNINANPTFCDARDSSVQSSLMHIGSPAFAPNNPFGVDVGWSNGEKCAWGTLVQSTTVSSGTVWALEDVIVAANISLVLGDGVRIACDAVDESNGGVSGSKHEINVLGTLVAEGTGANTVQFESGDSDPAAADWYGINVGPQGVLDLDYVEIRHCDYPVYRYHPNAGVSTAVTINHATIDHFAEIGILDLVRHGESGAAMTVTNSAIDMGGAVAGIQAIGDFPGSLPDPGSDIVIENTTITGGSSGFYGILLSTHGVSAEARVKNVNVSGLTAGTGLYIERFSPSLLSNTVSSCKWGVQLLGTGSPHVEPATGNGAVTSISGCTTGMYSSATSPVIDSVSISSPTGGTGIYNAGTSAGSYTAVTITGGSIGFDAQSTGIGTFRDGSIDGFTLNGVKYKYNSSAPAGLDLGNSLSAGNNQIYSGVPGVTKYVAVKTCVGGWLDILAESNWWGSTSPDPTKFAVCVDYQPLLPGPPMSGSWMSALARGIGKSVAPHVFRASPNPFSRGSTFEFSVAGTGHLATTLQLFNVAGRLVRTVVNANLTVGDHVIEWDGQDAAGKGVGSGIYFARLQVGSQQTTLKLIKLP